MPKCPICDAEVKPRAENKLFPFCSDRCKTIDLGKWLSEDYRVPGEPAEGSERSPAEGESRDADDEDGSTSKGDMRH